MSEPVPAEFEPVPRRDERATQTTARSEPIHWRTPLVLFLLTVVSTFLIGVWTYTEYAFPLAAVRAAARQWALHRIAWLVIGWLAHGWTYAVPLLGILLCHEFGHYLMARKHHVPASLPMFLPVPIPPFGTWGAIIKMRGRIRTRDALLDIGAAGPLAGVIVAIPVTYVGLRLSVVHALPTHGESTQEGTSIVYWLLKLVAKGHIPAGSDVFLHPMAMAGWVGLFVTMINLIPYGQLDGGHVAYALLHRIHDRLARFVVYGLVLLGIAIGVYWGQLIAHRHGRPWAFGSGYTQGFNWFVFAFLIWVLHTGSGGKHPPTDPGPLSPRRRVVAVITLALFGLLFMPVPLRIDVLP